MVSTAIALAPGDVVKPEHLPAVVRGSRTRGATEPPPAVKLELDDDDHALRATLTDLLARHEGNVVAVAKAVKRVGIDLAAFRRTC